MSAFLKTLKFTRYIPVPNGQQNRKSSSHFLKNSPQTILEYFLPLEYSWKDMVTRLIEIFHMTSRRPYWCPKTITGRPFWCFKQVLWTDLKPPVLCASAQGDKIKSIFRPLYKSLPNLQMQCQSISDWTPNSAILTKRLKILIFVKKLRVHCNDPVIHEQRFLKLPLN